MSQDERVLLQDIRSFTVQIRHSADPSIITGTGFVVSAGGLVVTCAHVLRAAGVDIRDGGGQQISVYFPKRAGSLPELRSASLVAFFTASEDDIVCLQVDGPLPLPADRVAVLGTAHHSSLHPFESYGYRSLAKYASGLAYGQILGEVEPPEGVALLADPVQLESSHIASGMSGSAVLDMRRNLVVGVVSETWAPRADLKDRDTAWAVNVVVLEFTDLGLELRREPLPLGRAPQPAVNPRLAAQTVPSPGGWLARAPRPLTEWVGRGRLLEMLTSYWRGEHTRVVGLVGFGGEGKSSLARRWVDLVVNGDDPPAGVLWWTFTDSANAEEFLDVAVEFMSGGRISDADAAVTGARSSVAAGLLRAHRYLFVLDGFETMQHQSDDQYGAIISSELREFLEFFAAPGHPSFCVLTSRASPVDLSPYVTYRQIDMQGLRVSSGIQLLRRLGVAGADVALARVVTDWAGHPLTLSLIAAYLVRVHRGDVRRMDHLPRPEIGLPQEELVRRVLEQYDACLSENERSFLVGLSVFRRPVDEDGLRVAGYPGSRAEVLKHLTAARVVRVDDSGRSSLHPLVRDFYERIGEGDPAARRELHAKAKRYYQSAVEAIPENPTLDDLAPGIEVVHHASRAGAYDEACEAIQDHLYRGDRGVLTRELNAWETALSSLLDLFTDGLQGQPLITDPNSRAWLMHEVATCLQMLGRLRESAAMARRAMQSFIELERWHDAAVSCQNLTELYFSLGSLPACGALVEDAFTLAARADDREDELVAETLRGALAHYHGHDANAGTAFVAALRLAETFTPIPALYSSSGHRYAEHLQRAGRIDEAVEVNLINLEVCRESGWQADEVACLVLAGNLALDRDDLESATENYRQARQIAQSITRRDVLIQALIGQSRLAARTGNRDAARAELEQALALARLGGYRLAEIDALLWLARAERETNPHSAWQHAAEAEQLSVEIDYHWGRVDAEATLNGLSS